MVKNLISVPQYVPVIQLSQETITNLSYISICFAMAVFLIGCNRINKKRIYGFRMIISSFLLLINPFINFILN